MFVPAIRHSTTARRIGPSPVVPKTSLSGAPKTSSWPGFASSKRPVRNSVRHVGARQLLVVVGFEPDDLVLEVTDDGRGFAKGVRTTSHRGTSASWEWPSG